MKIQTFTNGKGLIYGEEPSRITSPVSGTLVLGSASIPVAANKETVLPQLFNSASGVFKAEFITEDKVYKLRNVRVKRGFISPPSDDVVERAMLFARVDEVEEKCNGIIENINRLDKIFDTNALNFLIK
jgi:hypothetical protein